MADRTIEFLLIGRDQASRAFEAAGNAASKASGKVTGMLKEVGRGALLSAGSALGSGVASIVTGAFSGAQEAAQVTRVLNSQIANLGPTGRAAFGSAAEFANQLSASIGKDDDEIKAVQTKLASFPDAFRQGSLGADAMRRATTAAFDLQAIGIGSAESNIIGIGKALNDPIKGMTALSKAGVSFSDAQKKAIQQAMAQGDLAKAQSVILQGIESNAKGAAAAATSNIEKFKTMAANFAEGLAGRVLPLVEKFAGFLVANGPQIEAFFNKIGTGISAVVGWFTKGGESGSQLSGTLSAAFSKIWAAVGPVLSQIWNVISTQVIPAFSAFVNAMTPVVSFLVTTLGPTVSRIFAAILTVIKGALQLISGIFNVFAGLLSGDWSRMWTGIKQIASGAWTAIKGVFSAGIAVIKGVMDVAVGTLKAVAKRIVDGIADAFRAIVGKVKSIGGDIIDGLVSGIRGAAGRVWDAATSVVNKIPLAVRKLMGIASPSRVMRGFGRDIMRGLALGMDDETAAVEGRVSGLALTPSTGGGVLGMAGRGPTVINVYAGAVGSEDFLARTIREVQDRAEARGYGIGARLRVGT